MCLSIPSKITKINKDTNIATVDTMGVFREVSLDIVDQEVVVGDYVLIHIGYAMNKIDEEDALESLKLYEQIVEQIKKEDEEEAMLYSKNSSSN